MLKQDLTAFSNAFAFSVTVILMKVSRWAHNHLVVQLPLLLPAYLEKLDECETLILSSGGTILTALVLSYTRRSTTPTVTTIPCNNRSSKLNISCDPTLFQHLPKALVHSQLCRNSVNLSAIHDDHAMSVIAI